MRWPATRPAGLSARAIGAALRAFLAGLGYPRCGVTVWFAGDASLRALNARHRGKSAPTDILSWPYLAPGGTRAAALLGELAVSLQRARAQARENGWTLQTEVLRLLAHGCAHLAGYDHLTPAEDRTMRGLEERLLARVGLRGLYPPTAPRRRIARATRPGRFATPRSASRAGRASARSPRAGPLARRRAHPPR